MGDEKEAARVEMLVASGREALFQEAKRIHESYVAMGDGRDPGEVAHQAVEQHAGLIKMMAVMIVVAERGR